MLATVRQHLFFPSRVPTVSSFCRFCRLSAVLSFCRFSLSAVRSFAAPQSRRVSQGVYTIKRYRAQRRHQWRRLQGRGSRSRLSAVLAPEDPLFNPRPYAS